MTRFLGSLAALAAAVAAAPAMAASVFIDFDTNPSGQPINAPAAFDNASPLRNTFAAWGVHFSGAQPGQGGAILNASSFTSHALSGGNFLAFSAIAPGFVAPETISFDTAMAAVSISASALSHPMTFTMQAFTAGGSLVDSASLALGGPGYGLLSVGSPAADIRKVVLSVSGAGFNAYVFDNLSASTAPVPEPSAALLFALGGGLVAWRRARG